MKSAEINAFSRRFLFSGRVHRGTVEETHISWVILTRRYAFKIKKPVRLSFLDFSSLAKRRRFCDKELTLNQRFSEIYLEVAPLRIDSGNWSVGGGTGKIVDYAVVMKRLRSSKRMDVLLKKQQVNERSILRLARKVGRFHAVAQVVYTPFDVAGARRLFNDIESIRDFVSDSLGSSRSHVVRDAVVWSDTFLRKYGDRFVERVSLGYKRDLHGDLHSGNIFLYADPVIFDCLEFNDDLRQIDVLDEVAFLCMDLESFGRQDLSRQFEEAYRQRFSAVETQLDEDIFRYYKCYRANVRAKVHAIAARQASALAERERHLHRLARYLELIERYIRK